jgi:BMFP domain-containing protein YqiC
MTQAILIAELAKTEKTEGRTRTVLAYSGSLVDQFDRKTGKPYKLKLATDSEDAIDMTDWANGRVNLTVQHMGQTVFDVIGVVTRGWFEAGNLMADVKFTNRESFNETWQDIEEGILRFMSIEASWSPADEIEGKDTDGSRIVLVRKWKPFGLSLVGRGADPNARILAASRAEENELLARIEELEEKYKQTEAKLEGLAIVSKNWRS